MRRDFINVAIIWFTISLVVQLLLPGWDIWPLRAAEEADISDHSFMLLLKMASPVFVFMVTVIFYSYIKFRASSDKAEAGDQIVSNHWASGTWLAITLALNIIVVIHPGLSGLASFQGNRGNPDLVVEANAFQWGWKITYPKQASVTAEEGIVIISDKMDMATGDMTKEAPAMVLPVDRRVHFKVTADDSATPSGQVPGNVLHSFWIPAFRNKIDAIPGYVTDMYITPNKVVSYFNADGTINSDMRVQCAELCGSGHSYMGMPVNVVSQEDFDAWVIEQQKAAAALSGDPVGEGMALAKANACTSCHSADGKKGTGPTWKGLFGKEETFADGSTAVVDEAYLHESIVDPGAKLVKGNVNIMPKTFKDTLSDEEIAKIIEYIKSLK